MPRRRPSKIGSGISKQLQRVLDEMKIITEEIAEMKEREGGEPGDN